MNTRHSPRRRSSRRRPSTSQRRSPPSTIACTIARSRSVRSAAISAATSPGSKMRGSRRTPRTNGRPATVTATPTRRQAHAAPGSSPHRRRRGRPDSRRTPTPPPADAASSPPTTPTRHRRSAPRSPRPTRARCCAVMNPNTSCGAHLDRVLADDGEERLQIVRVGAHRVRPRPTRQRTARTHRPAHDRRHRRRHHTIAGDTANLRKPDHGDPPRPSSARGKTPRTVSPAGGSPV